MLIVDNREHKIITELNTRHIIHTVAQLELGDIKIEHNGNTLLIERKTITDLKASIIDGRYEEQKLRLKASPHHCIYIIEGVCHEQMCKTALISSVIRDKLHIINSTSVSDTVDKLETIIRRKDDYFTLSQEPIVYSSVITSCKKENLTPDICFRAMLKQIPGLSDILVEPIVTHYKSMANLITTLSTSTDPVYLISELSTGTRRVGTVCATTLIAFLFPQPAPPHPTPPPTPPQPASQQHTTQKLKLIPKSK